jgi:fumarate reductase (CoM/CoB) subunit B
MTTAHLETTAKRPLDEAGARSLYACSGCMRCRSFCKHDNEVGFALFSARQVAVDRQLAPAGAQSTLATFREHQNPFGANLAEAVGRFRAESPVRFQLFAGCSTLVKRPDLVEDALAVGAGFSAPMGVSRAGVRCCGYPLYAAGDIDAFRVHARNFAESLGPYPELVVLDPGCAYTLRVVYPRFDVPLGIIVRTIYEVLDEHRSHVPPRPPALGALAYHDACHLGRGLGQYEQPRRLLALAAERVLEDPAARQEAGCTGGGGLLPRTMPEVSVDVARRTAARVAPNGETVVTACPTSGRMLERAGRRTADLLAVLRRWLD